MRLDITKLQNDPGHTIPFDFREGFENLELGGERMDFTGPVGVRGVCEFTGKDFLVTGRITAEYAAVCSRCADEVRARAEIPFRALFSRRQGSVDPDVYTFEGGAIDLKPMATDELLMSIPIRHLCSPDCRGLCPACGADLNRADCGCRTREE